MDKLKIPHRLVVCGLSSLALAICFQQSAAYFIAIGDIVYRTGDRFEHSLSECPEMITNDNLEHLPPNRKAELYWSETTEAAIRHGFYLGLMISIVPAGIAADGFGAKGIMTTGISVSSLLSIAMPTLAMMGPTYIMFGRFIQGAAQGLVYPCINVILAHWVPLNELATYSAVVHSGQFLGSFLGATVTSRLSESWRFTFVFPGLLGLIWMILWVVLASSLPEDNIYISPSELSLISNHTKGVVKHMKEYARQYVPWSAIVSSPVVFFMMLIHSAGTWLHYSTLGLQVYYFQHVIRLPKRFSIDVTSLAEIGVVPSAMFWGVASDKIINYKIMSRTTTRKVFAVLPITVSTACLVCMPMVGCNGLAVSSLYVTICFWSGLYLPNHYSNMVELSPRHAGMMYAILRVTSVPIVSLVYALMVTICPEPSDIFGWQMAHLISGFSILMLAFPYLCFGSAEIENWNFFTKARSTRSPNP